MKAQRWYIHSVKQFTPLYGALFFDCDVDFEFGSEILSTSSSYHPLQSNSFSLYLFLGASNVKAVLVYEGITLMEKQEDNTYSQYSISYVSFPCPWQIPLKTLFRFN